MLRKLIVCALLVVSMTSPALARGGHFWRTVHVRTIHSRRIVTKIRAPRKHKPNYIVITAGQVGGGN
jgi:hypothetical protein